MKIRYQYDKRIFQTSIEGIRNKKTFIHLVTHKRLNFELWEK
jgi:hypothetical protein